MKHFNKLLFIFFLSPFFSVAQSNYKTGYVVTVKGDTLRGFIDFQQWDSNPTAISFKSAINDKNHQSFKVSNISFFNVDGFATYKKYTCSISMDETNTGHLTSGRDTSFRIDSIFLKILQKGKNIALYSYTDGLKTRFYVSEAPNYIPTELVYRIYDDMEKDAHSSNQTAEENTYRKQLFALANKYDALDDNLTIFLQSANYAQPDLLTIVSRINNISKAEYAKNYAEHGKFNFFAGAALNINNTFSTSTSTYTQDGGGPSTSFGPAVSFGFNFAPNPDAGRVIFRVELSMADAQFNSSYTLKVSPYGPVKLAYDQLTTSLIPQIIYNVYNSDNFKFYLGIGLLLSNTSYSNAVFEGQGANNATVATIVGVNPFDFIMAGNSFILKAGFQINKKWEIFGDYLPNVVSTKGGYWALDRIGEQIGIIYIIGK